MKSDNSLKLLILTDHGLYNIQEGLSSEGYLRLRVGVLFLEGLIIGILRYVTNSSIKLLVFTLVRWNNFKELTVASFASCRKLSALL